MQADRGAWARRHQLALKLTGLVVWALLMLLPGRASIPPVDRDESRYMQATSQMLETGNYVDVRFQDRPRYLQPAGIYWLEAASVHLFGQAETRAVWVFRLPSLLGGVLSVVLTGWMAARLFGRRAGVLAPMLLAASVLFGVEGRVATIDATQLAFILIAQTVLLEMYLQRESQPPASRGLAVIYWLALGCGLMLKGPVILLVSWGTLLGLGLTERQWRWMRLLHPLWGVPLMLLVVLPWCVAIWVISHGEFFARSIGHNFLNKAVSGQEAHGLPPGYHLLAFVVAFWPGSLAAVLALPYAWAQRREPRVRFLLCWIVPCWVVFELIATKLPHYVLPAYPAIALLTAAAACTPTPWRSLVQRDLWGILVRLYAVIWGLASVALAVAGPVLMWRVENRIPIAPILASFMALLAIAGMIRCTLRRQPGPSLAYGAVAALVISFSTYALVLPALTTVWLSPRIAQAVRDVQPCSDSIVASSSFSEPSLVFLVGRQTQLVDARQAADFLSLDQRCGLALIGTKDQDTFLRRVADHGLQVTPLRQVTGVNYSTGKRLDLILYRAGAS